MVPSTWLEARLKKKVRMQVQLGGATKLTTAACKVTKTGGRAGLACRGHQQVDVAGAEAAQDARLLLQGDKRARQAGQECGGEPMTRQGGHPMELKLSMVLLCVMEACKSIW